MNPKVLILLFCFLAMSSAFGSSESRDRIVHKSLACVISAVKARSHETLGVGVSSTLQKSAKELSAKDTKGKLKSVVPHKGGSRMSQDAQGCEEDADETTTCFVNNLGADLESCADCMFSYFPAGVNCDRLDSACAAVNLCCGVQCGSCVESVGEQAKNDLNTDGTENSLTDPTSFLTMQQRFHLVACPALLLLHAVAV